MPRESILAKQVKEFVLNNMKLGDTFYSHDIMEKLNLKHTDLGGISGALTHMKRIGALSAVMERRKGTVPVNKYTLESFDFPKDTKAPPEAFCGGAAGRRIVGRVGRMEPEIASWTKTANTIEPSKTLQERALHIALDIEALGNDWKHMQLTQFSLDELLDEIARRRR